MSKIISVEPIEVQLNDAVFFDHEGQRLAGKVVRIYFGDEDTIHVQAQNIRYEVSITADNVVKVPEW
jgi:hypothetical protein